ncbi:hypothetical protein U5640_12985 [Streptomyces sp. SS7]|uniref:hypothetical protein n=1 Tax=Streptomyces sp. SS7 TaxID=3108485 RepID=UPI0030ED9301
MTAADDPWAALREDGVAHLMITAGDEKTVRAIVTSLRQRHTVQEPDVRLTGDGVVESQLYLRVGGQADGREPA